MHDLELIASAEKLAREVIQVKKEDTVLVVTDAEKLRVGKLCPISSIIYITQ